MCLASQIGEHTHTLMLTLNMKVGFWNSPLFWQPCKGRITQARGCSVLHRLPQTRHSAPFLQRLARGIMILCCSLSGFPSLSFRVSLFQCLFQRLRIRGSFRAALSEMLFQRSFWGFLSVSPSVRFSERFQVSRNVFFYFSWDLSLLLFSHACTLVRAHTPCDIRGPTTNTPTRMT